MGGRVDTKKKILCVPQNERTKKKLISLEGLLQNKGESPRNGRTDKIKKKDHPPIFMWIGRKKKKKKKKHQTTKNTTTPPQQIRVGGNPPRDKPRGFTNLSPRSGMETGEQKRAPSETPPPNVAK